VSKIIKNNNPDVVIDGNTSPPRTGSFEVELDGKSIFSKFQSGRFPAEDEIDGWFQKLS